MLTTRIPILAIALLSLLGPGVPAASAQAPIPSDIITAATLTAPQRDTIARYAKQYQEDLLSDDPVTAQRARKRLAEPLTKTAVSGTFRREYASHLLDSIRAGSNSKNEHVAVNSLLLAGYVATTESLDVIEQKLTAESVPVRYAAVAGATLLFVQINDNAPTIFEDRVSNLTKRLADVVRKDQNTSVLDAGVRSLVAAARQKQYPKVGATALAELPHALRDRLRDLKTTPDLQTLAALIRATDTIRTVLIQDVDNAQTAVANDAAELAGHVLAFIGDRIEAGDFKGDSPEAEQARNAASQIVALAENTIVLVNDDYKGGASIAKWNLSTAISNGEIDTVPGRIRQDVIGPSGVLTEPPFPTQDGRFDR